MSNIHQAIGSVFKETSDFILVGLTGRTGSGCSTTANLLSSSDEIDLPGKSEIYKSKNDQNKFKIISQFIKNNWTPFRSIKVTKIITAFILKMDFEEFIDFTSKELKKERKVVYQYFNNFKDEYEEIRAKVNNNSLSKDIEIISRNKDEILNLYFDDKRGGIRHLGLEIKNSLKLMDETICKDTTKRKFNSYIKLYQQMGDNIRASGKVNSNDFDKNNIFTLAESINNLVKIIRKIDKQNNKKSRIVIDAIRNPFEALFFKQRYASFYLFSINTKETRLIRLKRNDNLSDEQIEELDNKEYPKKLVGADIFTSQNIQKCIEISDIHIHNPNRNSTYTNELCSQLAWYMALILHPGLVTPTAIERNMQFAYTTKLNSGCISRQVGAVVTDRDYSVKAVGWNSTPAGQVPCVLRNAEDLLNGGNKHTFSKYERNDKKFKEKFEATYKAVMKNKELLGGRNVSFCFKDIQNEVEEQKNQVHTRSLHAEENAFLQIAKYGGQPLVGGILFSTASPCELCAKKAYQLGISKIIYVDPYPGIARDNIIESGEPNSRPKMTLYRGALGRAYHKLYQPFMNYKDELQLLTDYKLTKKETLKCKKLKDENHRLNIKIMELERASKVFCASLPDRS